MGNDEFPPDGNEIEMFFHCDKCLEEKPDGISPREWAELEVGWTEQGFQVWCKRHECNVINMDFEGHKHPADVSCVDEKRQHSHLRLVEEGEGR